jgi:sialic acid synthase SpsE
MFFDFHCIVSTVELVPGRRISSNEPCFFIAEIGQNHQGSFEIAKELIKAAHVSVLQFTVLYSSCILESKTIFSQIAGADCVKFQKTSIPHKFTDAALKKPYLSAHSWGKTYGEHKQHLELSDEHFRVLKSYANSLNLAFSASPKDIVSERSEILCSIRIRS